MSVQPAKAPSHFLPCPVVGRGGYNGGERAFVSFASRRLRLTIYWRRAGLVDDGIQLCTRDAARPLAVLVPTSCICKPS
jgi:hypothetical protein